MSTLPDILEQKKNELRNICQAFHVKRMYVFGSLILNTFNKDSDIDLLISFADGLSVEEYVNNYFSLHDKLRDLFNRDIDIITETTLSNPYFIESINESKVLMYEA